FGWIDGIRRGLGPDTYGIRFTPRRPRSNWSAINIKRVAELQALGLMQSAGLAAFEARTEDKSRIYSYENKPMALPAEYAATFRSNAAAWTFFESEPPSYRRTAMYWVMDAKRAETRLRRLAALIEDSANRRRIGPLRRTE
ncbi:MAG: YdeI/OmpD-associated family protein, partial [Dehalococcoidia bacterium]